MNKRLVHILLAAGVVVVALLLATNRRPAATRPDRRLVVLSRLWSAPHEKDFVITDILSPFEDAHDCTVDFQTLDDEALLKRLSVQQLAEQITTDVAIVYVSRMREWVAKGLVIDLTPSVAAWADRTFCGGFAGMTTFNERQYFLPIGADTYLLCANREALKYLPQGASLSSLSWPHFADWALAILEGEGEGKLAVTGVAQKMLIYQFSAAVLSYGGGFPDVASPGALAAWRLFIKMRGAFTPTVRTYDSVVPAMKRGEAWLTVAHNARVGEIFSSNPVNFVIAPPPRGPAGMGAVAGVSGLAVVKGCPHPGLAVAFVEYLTRPDVQVKLARGTGGFIPTVNETAALLGQSREDQVIRAAADVLERGLLAYIPTYRDWPGVKLAYDEAFHEMVLGTGEIETDRLQEAQTRINRIR